MTVSAAPRRTARSTTTINPGDAAGPNPFGEPLDPNEPYAGPPAWLPEPAGPPPPVVAPPSYPGYPTSAGYPTAGYPGGYPPPNPGYGPHPGYPPNPGYPTGYPPNPGYPTGYPPYPGYPSGYPGADYRVAAARPGQAVAAGVLSLICAAFLLLGGFVVIFAASSLESNYDVSSERASLFVVAGLVNVIAAVLLLAGGVLILTGANGSRASIVIGALICVGLGVFWLAQPSSGSSVLVWELIFCGPAIAALVLTLTSRVTAWLAAGRRH